MLPEESYRALAAELSQLTISREQAVVRGDANAGAYDAVIADRQKRLGDMAIMLARDFDRWPPRRNGPPASWARPSGT